MDADSGIVDLLRRRYALARSACWSPRGPGTSAARPEKVARRKFQRLGGPALPMTEKALLSKGRCGRRAG